MLGMCRPYSEMLGMCRPYSEMLGMCRPYSEMLGMCHPLRVSAQEMTRGWQNRSRPLLRHQQVGLATFHGGVQAEDQRRGLRTFNMCQGL